MSSPRQQWREDGSGPGRAGSTGFSGVAEADEPRHVAAQVLLDLRDLRR